MSLYVRYPSTGAGSGGGGGGGSYNVNIFVLTPTDITNGFVTLSSIPTTASDTGLTVIGGPLQNYGVDFTITGATLTFLGDLAIGGNAALVSGDKLFIQFD